MPIIEIDGATYDTDNPDLTGRDSMIVAKALAYAIVSIDAAHLERSQEESDWADMKAILSRLRPSHEQRSFLLYGARAHLTGEPPPSFGGTAARFIEYGSTPASGEEAPEGRAA